LTGSSENYIRDTLAYSYVADGQCAARDHRVTDTNGKLHIIDIALLSDGLLSTCIELKTLYLKELREDGTQSKYSNLERDMEARGTLCDDVCGIVLVRDVVGRLSRDGEAIAMYVRQDARKRESGIQRIHNFIKIRSGPRHWYPDNSDDALIHKSRVDLSRIGLSRALLGVPGRGRTNDPGGNWHAIGQ
jgi:hypothetical protein